MSADPNALLLEAQKKEKSKGWFGGNKKDDAADLYGRAANGFKLKKQCTNQLISKRSWRLFHEARRMHGIDRRKR
jgi:hypothetical protein